MKKQMPPESRHLLSNQSSQSLLVASVSIIKNLTVSKRRVALFHNPWSASTRIQVSITTLISDLTFQT